jgi:outer membrane lipoprotein SlyB
MSPDLRRKTPPLLLAAIISVVSLVGVVILTGLYAPGAARRDGTPLGDVGAASRGDAEPAIRLNDPSICALCGVVEAVRPYEIRSTSATPGGEDAQEASAAALVPRTAYRVTVRMEDGSYRTLSQPTRPMFKSGDRVRIADGALLAR